MKWLQRNIRRPSSGIENLNFNNRNPQKQSTENKGKDKPVPIMKPWPTKFPIKTKSSTNKMKSYEASSPIRTRSSTNCVPKCSNANRIRWTSSRSLTYWNKKCKNWLWIILYWGGLCMRRTGTILLPIIVNNYDVYWFLICVMQW